MTAAFAIVLIVHGLIHLLGFAKAFGVADLPQLTQPISPFFGALWLLAALLFLAAAAALSLWPRGWWAIGACAIVVSMFVIVPSWTDAKFGALANLVALIGVVFGFLAQGPVSLRAAYERDLDRALARVAPAEPIRETDLAHLPAPVRRYLRGVGVVGQPVEVAPLRSQFATWLNVGSRRPDLVVRFGRGPEMPRSLRRPIEQVLA